MMTVIDEEEEEEEETHPVVDHAAQVPAPHHKKDQVPSVSSNNPHVTKNLKHKGLYPRFLSQWTLPWC